MPLYDAVCVDGHKFETFLKMDNRGDNLVCPVCSKTANTVVSAVRSKLDGTDPSLPGAYLKWERDRSKPRK